MSTLRKRFTATVAIVIGLAVTPALSGCFGNPVEGILEQVTGGNVDLGGNTIPADFPSEVPVYQGEVLTAIGLGSGTDKIFNVSVRVPSQDTINEITTQFEDAGFAAQPITETADGATAAFTADKWGVLVVLTKDDAGFIANYTVTPTGQ